MAHYDTCDPDRRVVLLTRAIHHLWAQRRKIGLYLHQETAIDEALETLFEAKRQVKATIAVEKSIESREIKARFYGKATRPPAPVQGSRGL